MHFFRETQVDIIEYEQFDMRQIPDPQTRLDRYMDGMFNDIVTSKMIAWMYNDLEHAENELKIWESMHPNDCHRVSSEPLSLRISITIDKNYKKKIHDDYYRGKVPLLQKRKFKRRKKF